VVIDDDFDVVKACRSTADLRTSDTTEHSVASAIGNAPKLLVVLMDEGARMASDITNRSSRDSIGIGETVEAAADKDSMNRRSRSSQDRAEAVRSIAGALASRQDLGLGCLTEPAWRVRWPR
jgi:hypothetical protein